MKRILLPVLCLFAIWVAPTNGEQIAAVYSEEQTNKFDGAWTGKITATNFRPAWKSWKYKCAFDKNETINIHIKNGEVNTKLVNYNYRTIEFQTKLDTKDTFETPQAEWEGGYKTFASISGEIEGKVLKGFYIVEVNSASWTQRRDITPVCWGDFKLTRKPSPTVTAKKTPTPKPVQKVAKRPDDIAVIIANSNYTKQGKDIPNVTPAYNDAKNIKKYFMESLGVREGNIIYLKDATGAQLTEVFGNKENHKAQLFDWVRPNKSNIHIYYAGHGAPASKDGSAYLVPSDAKSQKIEFSGYPLTNLYRNLDKIRARSVTVILEACFSGFSQGGAVLPRSSGIMVVAREPTVPSNLRVISAGAADQIASWEEDGSQSLFTKYFLKGMSGEGDKKPYGNGDGKVDDRELKKYLDDTMTYYARRYYGRDQTAQIVVNGKELSLTN